MNKYEYRVYHGWAFSEYVVLFKTKKNAIKFIEAQEFPDDWCFEKVKRRTEMRRFTIEEIAAALIENDSMERDGENARYFLHITDAGEILPTLAGADETFTAGTDAPDEDGDWREDFETLENEDFRNVCEDLCRQANDYLETWGEEE